MKYLVRVWLSTEMQVLFIFIVLVRHDYELAKTPG